MRTINLLASAAGITAAGGLSLGLLLILFSKFGAVGKSCGSAFTRAPLLDVIIALITWIPWVVGAAFAGWLGVAGAVLGQVVSIYLFSALHEAMNLESVRGPRIVRFLNRTVGRFRNHAALWVTLVAVPGFWIIRLLQWLAYPLLVWLLGFPRYRHSEWINVSRQKFNGLVGHDLLWCLYCDWMTGVYSLGAEMLRNVESFWCPIRFQDGKKCDNCKLDFPDIEKGWVPPDGTMRDVEKTLEEKYGTGERSWFGHPARLTARGKPIEPGKNGP